MKQRSHWLGLVPFTFCLSFAACGGIETPPTPSTRGSADAGTPAPIALRATPVDKVDLLFVLDNSASMGDKHEILAKAVPDLVQRLVSGSPGVAPVHDLHIGVVSSSLGGFGSDVCKDGETNPTDASLDRHNNDRGRLVNRGGAKETPVASAQPSSFLAWFPSAPENEGKTPPTTPITDAAQLVGDFATMVAGVHEYGCGLEAQMESWYHFLVAPDPWANVRRDGNTAVLDGLDDVVLAQRREFLRPDSLVAIVVVTDEDDSSPDPLAVGGQGWAYSNSSFPGSKTNGGAARGTKICETNPADPGCTSCGFGLTPNDPSCQLNGGYYEPSDDTLNVRYHRMKQRYGVDPQYPIQRYVDALTKALVPNREGEHPKDATTGKPSKDYVGDAKCNNPLFARSLPSGAGEELCALPRGPRTPDMVVFGVIGGVPNQLLHFDPVDPEASRLTVEDWTKILGKDPRAFEYTGIDPHMIESIAPRAGLPGPGSADDADPIHGRDFDTKSNDALDLQYACTFALPTAKNCKDPKNMYACDCDGVSTSPLCAPNPADGNKRSLQIRAKAYPSVRELMVARALGDQGVVASVCPMHAVEQGQGDPLFGYRPAVASLTNAMSRAGLALGPRCVSGLPAPDASGRVACRMLVVQPDACSAGLSPADAQSKAALQAARELSDGEVACELPQRPVPAGQTCAKDVSPGFCVVQAGSCATAVAFTEAANPAKGSRTYIQCE